MNVCDFSRSFVTFRIDLEKKRPKTVSQEPPFTLNNARLQLDCRSWFTWPGASGGGAAVEVVLSASCKTEQVNVKQDIWHEPNADMCLLASEKEFMVIKSWDRNNRGVMLWPPSLGEQPDRQPGTTAEAFDRLRIDIHENQGKVLQTTQQIIDAALANRPLVSRTEFTAQDGTHVLLEYPVKVLNVSERDRFYQIDTGPVLVPDPEAFDGQNPISILRKAFIAHNSLGCTEFIVNVPTPIADSLSVNHYSKVLKVEAVNTMIELSDSQLHDQQPGHIEARTIEQTTRIETVAAQLETWRSELLQQGRQCVSHHV